MTIYCDDFAALEGDFHSHEGWGSEWVSSGKVRDKNPKRVKWVAGRV